MKIKRTVAAILSVVSLLAAAGSVAHAESAYPSRTIRMIVAYPAGSVNDIFARAVSDGMANFLGVPVIVENKSGAGGILGTKYVINSSNDGYTIGFGTSSQLVMNAATPDVGIDFDKDITPIGLVSTGPLVLVVSKDRPSTLKELIADAKAHPAKLTFGSAGMRSISHVLGESLNKAAGVELVHVPFTGQAPALNAVLGSHVDMLFDAPNTAMSAAAGGQVKVVAIGELPGTPGRSPEYPDLPTFAEAGLPNFECYTWTSLFGPPNMDPKIVSKLNEALGAGLKAEGMQRTLKLAASKQFGPSTPAETAKIGAEQRAKWVPFISNLKIGQ